MTWRLALVVVLVGGAIVVHVGRGVASRATARPLDVPGVPAPRRVITIQRLVADSFAARLATVSDRALTPGRRCQRLALHALGLVRAVEPPTQAVNDPPATAAWDARRLARGDSRPTVTAFYGQGTDTIVAMETASHRALAHEWVHAVDDERSDRLARGAGPNTTDEALALHAAIEGTAMVAVPMSLPAVAFTSDLDINAWILAYAIGPRYIRRVTHGALPAAFALSPGSVWEILFGPSASRASRPPLEPPALAGGERLLCSDQLGALAVLTALRRTRISAGEASTMARAWAGDRVDRVLERDGSVRVVWRVRFTTGHARVAWARADTTMRVRSASRRL
jgi:hypothetical protein